MSVYDEPPFRFDFSTANDSVKHDAPPHNIWRGVDFRVMETSREVWVEVKSWKFKAMQDRTERKRSQGDYNQKFLKNKVNEFRDEIITKFLGTTSYLAWSQIGVPSRVYYIVFLEPPNRGSQALIGPFQDRVRNEFKNVQTLSWGRRIQYKVVNLAEFQREFPNYPVTWLR